MLAPIDALDAGGLEPPRPPGGPQPDVSPPKLFSSC